jgi:hypothetical protein
MDFIESVFWYVLVNFCWQQFRLSQQKMGFIMKIMGELLPLHVASKTKLGLRIFKKYGTQKSNRQSCSSLYT